MKGIKAYTEDQFLDAMEELVQIEGYHVSRFDKYRAAVAKQQLLAIDNNAMTVSECWTQSKTFSLKLKKNKSAR